MSPEILAPEAARDRVLEFILAPEERDFEELALAIFACQYKHNRAYRSWCDSLRLTPASVARVDDIPAVPTSAFKEMEFACAPPETEFRTSGTTGSGNGRHLLPWLLPYRTGALAHFSRCVLPEGWKMRTLVLAPPVALRPTSSLSHMLAWIVEEFGEPGSGWFVSEAGLAHERLAEALLDVQHTDVPVLILGTSAAFLDFFHYCQQTRLTLLLPDGSRLMDTGGWKGTGRPSPWSLSEFQRHCYRRAGELLGIPERRCINEYGMTELCSQFYDSPLSCTRIDSSPPRIKVGPPWTRTRILDPSDLQPAAPGAIGLIQHIDLANVGSVISVLTEDLGRACEGGFILEGRPRQAEARGCGLTFAEFSTAR
jgi:hypothetical protein